MSTNIQPPYPTWLSSPVRTCLGIMQSSFSRRSVVVTVVVKVLEENTVVVKISKGLLRVNSLNDFLTSTVVFLRKFNDDCNDDWTTTERRLHDS